MQYYCVNNVSQPNGDHEVHVQGCAYWPNSNTPLGQHSSCHTAVAQAKRYYLKSNGCYWCCRPCHTT